MADSEFLLTSADFSKLSSFALGACVEVVAVGAVLAARRRGRNDGLTLTPDRLAET